MKHENPTELLKLIEANPDLPVIPMVDSEVVADDYCGYWMASWGWAAVDEYLILPDVDRPVVFKSDDEVFDTLENYLSMEEFEALPETEEGCRPFFDALPWKRAIVVYIGLPEE